jgi:hypothetical protein
MDASYAFCGGLILGWISMAAFLAVLVIPIDKKEREDDGHTGNH